MSCTSLRLSGVASVFCADQYRERCPSENTRGDAVAMHFSSYARSLFGTQNSIDIKRTHLVFTSAYAELKFSHPFSRVDWDMRCCGDKRDPWGRWGR